VDAPLRKGPMLPSFEAPKTDLGEIVALLREIRDLLKPKPLGRPKKEP
jgi:hypothetical protein